MSGIIYSILVLVYFGAGAGSSLLAYQLHKSFNHNYLSSLFYYQLCCVIFCMYSIIGYLFVKEILADIEQTTPVLEMTAYLISFLGVPFLFACWFMFIKFSFEFIGQRISQYFSLSYFGVTVVILFTCSLYIKSLKDFNTYEYDTLKNILAYSFAGAELLTLCFVLLRLRYPGKSNIELNKQKAITEFSILITPGYITSIIFIVFALFYKVIVALFIFIYLSKNIVALIKLRRYLITNYFDNNEVIDEDKLLKKLCNAYQISPREQEIIVKINEGKSNKEISGECYISLQTVKDHIYRIYQKTGVKNRVQLINLLHSI